jgi:NAD(P)-dependent dehydrogenase (short-subunit alcohol dehydrogenase family)
MVSYLVTGANRGLGLALVVKLSSLPDTLIFAAARTSSPALQSLINSSNGKITELSLEISKPASIVAAVEVVQKHLGDNGLDVLINNAGTQPYTPGGTAMMDDLTATLEVNVTSVHRVTAAFLPLLRKGSERKVVNMWVAFAKPP